MKKMVIAIAAALPAVFCLNAAAQPQNFDAAQIVYHGYIPYKT